MVDPNFDRTVVLVIEHKADEGALGVVINRPTEIEVRDVLERWADYAALSSPGVVFSGGPVSPGSAIGLSRLIPAPGRPGRGTVGEAGNPGGQAGVGGVGSAGSAGLPWSHPAAGSDTGESGTGRPIFDGVHVVDLGGDPDSSPGGIRPVRIFFGYAGWAPGQLEEEEGAGAWFVLDALPGDAFSSDPLRLWHDVLFRQGGELAMMANYPPHPRLN